MLELSRIKAITLDLDDTLWPVWPTIHRAEKLLQDWLADCAPATSALFASVHVRRELREATEAALPHLTHDLSAMRQEMIRRGLEQAGEDQSLAPAAFQVFFDARNEVNLFEDSLDALRWLSRQYPVLAVSNGNASVQKVGLAEYFVGSVSARDAGAAKPDARIFQAAADYLKLPPSQILHVGDDAALDVLGALAFGMQTAWVNREDHAWAHPQHPHISVTSMAELCDALGR